MLAVALCALLATASPPGPNVALITLDTVRADRMGFLGSTAHLTPTLDALAARGLVFTRAYAQVPLTNPSHAVILSGTYPQRNFVNDFAIPLAGDVPYLPAILKAHGYRTGAFVAASVLAPAGAPGFDRGFDVYDAGVGDRRSAAAVVERALGWIRASPKAPFFLWVHLYDAHAPYEPPEPFRSRHPGAPYDGCIEYVDAQLGALVRELDARGPAVIAVMADHGEAFGEHGERQHGYLLYDETIHVPLVLRLPGPKPRMGHVTAPVGLVDVAPTILDALGLPVAASMQGRVLPFSDERSRSGGSEAAAVYSETEYPYLAFGWSPLRAWRTAPYLFVEAPRRELYLVSGDPAARRNLAAERPAVTAELAAALDSFRRRTRATGAPPPAVVDAQTAHELNALGYVAAAGGDTERPPNGVRADPKDVIEIANEMSDGLLLMNAHRYADALPLLKYAEAHAPDSVVVNRVLGEELIWLQDYPAALRRLHKALDLGSDVAMTHYQIGLAFFGMSAWTQAASEFRRATEQAPRWAEAHYSLGAADDKLDRMDEAEREFQAALAIQPAHPFARSDLARLRARRRTGAAQREEAERPSGSKP